MCAPSMMSVTPQTAGAAALTITQVDDADGHEATVRGATVRAFRLGEGVGPNLTATREAPGFAATWVRAGFPMASRATTSPDRTYAIAAIRAPTGSRWCGHPLKAGELMFYGPDVHHTAVNPVGVTFAFASIETQRLVATADTMGLTPNLPKAGEVRILPSSASHALWRTVVSLAAPGQARAPHDQGRELLRTTVETLTEESTSTSCRRLDNGALVSACLAYAETVDRIPSMEELCAATFVCRRKLWDAFDERYGTSPARFLRTWGLAQARERLLEADPRATTVLDVANGLGFHHAGRFASRYRQMFGEPPSRTLRAAS
jgi:AraC-like DNA-binding protein